VNREPVCTISIQLKRQSGTGRQGKREGGGGEEIDTRTHTNNHNEESLSSCLMHTINILSYKEPVCTLYVIKGQ
jgi:hypothetical protein